jgi:hypothetical protein
LSSFNLKNKLKILNLNRFQKFKTQPKTGQIVALENINYSLKKKKKTPIFQPVKPEKHKLLNSIISFHTIATHQTQIRIKLN